MSAPQPPAHPTISEQDSQFASAKNTISISLLVACPVLILLPPRKLDFYTFSLGAAWVASANHVVTERTGRGFMQRAGGMVSARGGGLPTEKAKDVQERLRRERLLRAQPSGQGMEIAGLERGGGIREDGSQVRSSLATSTGGENDDVDNEQSAEGRGIVGMAKKAWLGGEGEDWKEKRLREEKEALETGKGYSGLIIDQIWDVWNGGKVDNERNEGNEETRPKDEEKDGS